MHISTLAISYLSAVLSLRDTGLEHERRLIKPFGTLPSVINELCYVGSLENPSREYKDELKRIKEKSDNYAETFRQVKTSQQNVHMLAEHFYTTSVG